MTSEISQSRVEDEVVSARRKERFPGQISVALLITHGRSGRLLLTRHGTKQGRDPEWGPVAGGVDQQEFAWDAGLREAWEEAYIGPQNLIFVRGRNSLEPHVAHIRLPNVHRLGLVFDVTYSGPVVNPKGWEIKDDKSVDFAQFFKWQDVIRLLENPDQIYLPEFNFPQLLRWLLFGHGASQKRTESVSRWFESKLGEIPGLERAAGLNPVGFKYTPPYNDWMLGKNLHGDPGRTNFARPRYYERTK